jgi:hypothetical protein
MVSLLRLRVRKDAVTINKKEIKNNQTQTIKTKKTKVDKQRQTLHNTTYKVLSFIIHHCPTFNADDDDDDDDNAEDVDAEDGAKAPTTANIEHRHKRKLFIIIDFMAFVVKILLMLY